MQAWSGMRGGMMPDAEQVGVKATPRLSLQRGARVQLEITRELGRHKLRLVAVVPGPGYRGGSRLHRHVLDEREYDDEEGVWIGIQSLCGERLLALADNTEVDTCTSDSNGRRRENNG